MFDVVRPSFKGRVRAGSEGVRGVRRATRVHDSSNLDELCSRSGGDGRL